MKMPRKLLMTLLLSFIAPLILLLPGARPDAPHAPLPWSGTAVSAAGQDGTWLMSGSVRASDGRVVDHFGQAAALHGNTAIIGAHTADIGGRNNQGAAYIFERAPGGWREQQKLSAADGAADHYFGREVAIDGDTAIISGDHAAYVFVRLGDQWQEQQKLVSADGAWLDGGIALQGSTLITGAPELNIGDNIRQGAAYVFVRGGGIWRQEQKLVAGDGGDYGKFGNAVAMDGNTAIIGARGTPVAGDDGRGAAYVYTRSGSTWQQGQKLVVDPGDGFKGLGSSVALDGDTAVLGATGNGQATWSAAYVFSRGGEGWQEQQLLLPSDWKDFDLFGYSTAVYKDTVIVGAPGLLFIYYDAGPGAVYIFRRGGDQWQEQQKLIVAGNGEAGDEFGLALAHYRYTLLIGAPSTDYHPALKPSVGRAYFYERWYEPRAFLPAIALPGGS